MKGPGVGAAGNGAEHGGLHLHEAHIVQIPAQIRYELAADLKVPLGFGIHNEIHIPLAVAQLLVRQTVELLRQGGWRDFDSRVISWARMLISPFWVRNTSPLTPTISPMSYFLKRS